MVLQLDECPLSALDGVLSVPYLTGVALQPTLVRACSYIRRHSFGGFQRPDATVKTLAYPYDGG